MSCWIKATRLLLISNEQGTGLVFMCNGNVEFFKAWHEHQARPLFIRSRPHTCPTIDLT